METDCTYISYRQTNSFSELVNDYIEGDEKLSGFYQFKPDIEGIKQAIEQRSNFPVDRQVLAEVLRKQYETLPVTEGVTANIEALLNANTFTICTAHQPNLLTGYLYFFYKILHAIKMAESLNEQFPGKHFVPVYYMGSEDNDLEELGQFRYEGQQYSWDAEGQTGAVGRMSTKSLKPLLSNLFKRLGPPGLHYDDLVALLSESYLNHATIAEATQYLVHQLFGKYGLVIINSDEAALKKLFLPVLKDDLFGHTALPIVAGQSELLAKEYKAQAFPREINLFYLKDAIRERIEKSGQVWQVVNTAIRFSELELRTELENFPERFSPNVILRGLFQETILPNICFVGGGSELAYWLQLKPLFDYYKVFYPVVYLRQSVQLLSTPAWELMALLSLDTEEVFADESLLTRQLITEKKGITWSVTHENEILQELVKTLAIKAKKIDSTLEKSALSVLAKIDKQVKVLEQKMYRAEKRNEEIMVDRLRRLKAVAFPGGGLQERVENFMPYYLQEGFELFDTIKNRIKPFDNKFLVLHPKK